MKGLGLFDSTMIVVGSMIGSGNLHRFGGHRPPGARVPGFSLVVWLAAGAMTLIGALSYGELAAAMPHAGGQYVYLRESLGPLWGFLYGWTMLLVIQTATIAAVAIAFAKFTAVLVPWFSASAVDLEDRHVWAVAVVVRFARALQRRPEPPEPSGHSLDRFSHLGQHARPAVWQDRPEHFHGHQDRSLAGSGAAGVFVFDRGCAQQSTSPISGATPDCRSCIPILRTARPG